MSRDHVFGEAFGGRVTVTVHTSCNSELGRSAEGRLHRPNTLMSLVRASCGLPAPELRGATSDGTGINLNLVTGRSSEARPQVDVTHQDDRVELSARGDERDVRGVLKDWRRKYGEAVPTWDELPPEAHQEVLSPPTDVTASIVHDLNDTKQFAVKAALGAGVLAFGGGFARCDLARALREYRDSEVDVTAEGVEMSRAALAALDEKFAVQADMYAASGLSRPELPGLDSGKASDVIFIPYKQQTAVFVRVLGVPLTNGIRLDAPLPAGELGTPAAPVVVREGTDELVVADYMKLLLEPVARRAEAQAVLDLDEPSG